MKKLETPNYSDEVVRKFLVSQVKKKRFRAKNVIESFERFWVLYRPFRHITLKISGFNSKTGFSKFSKSMIDEDLAGSITDVDHRFLLWRPRLENLNEESFTEERKRNQYSGKEESVQEVIDEMVRLRLKGQEKDEELRPKIRSLQADPLSSIAFIVPRSPGGIRREEKLLDERKWSHAYVMASSLVSNCSPKDVVLSAELGTRVHIETVVAEYRKIENGETRLLLLETPGTLTLRDAQKAGSAITRICQLYKTCSDRIQDDSSL